MKRSKKLTQLFSVAALCSNVMEGMPNTSVLTQTKEAKRAIPAYLKSLPKFGMDNLLSLAKLGNFDLLKLEAETNPSRSAFRMFNFAQSRRVPGNDWIFPFSNSDEEGFEDIVNIEFGMCAGFTLLLRKMNMLAFYDPENLEMQSVPDRIKKPKEWLKFMHSKVDDIVDLHMAIIPSFKNLKEFSSDPEIGHYLRTKILHEWKTANVNLFQGTQAILGATKQSLSETERAKTYTYLESRLNLGYNPTVYLVRHADTFASSEQWIHVVQVTGIQPKAKDGSYKIQIWDVNSSLPSYADVSITVRADGQINYAGMMLGNIIPLKWDDLEISYMIKNNIDFCIDRPDLCNPIKTNFSLNTRQ